MLEPVDGWPVWLVFAFFWFGATARGQALYWLGRVVSARLASGRASAESRVGRWVSGPGVSRGIEVVRKWGVVAIPACYLTVGVQSLVLTAAGVLRISWPVFSLAQVPGTLAWAAIYSTIGWAAWEAALFGLARSPLGTAMIAALVVAVIAGIVVRRRRASRRERSSG